MNEVAKEGAKKAKEGAKKAGKLAGDLKASVTSKYLKFRAPEEDPLVPELLSKAGERVQRSNSRGQFTGSLTHHSVNTTP